MAWDGTGTLVTSYSSSRYPTTTRAALRQAICRELNMDFAKRYKSTRTASGGTTLTLIDTGMNQDNDFWNNQWLYIPGLDEQDRITDWVASTHTLTVENGFSRAINNTDTYEILSIWNAFDIHAAINRAIEDSYPVFFDVITDESLIMQEDKLSYSLTTLTQSPYYITKVWAERATGMSGVATSTSSTTLVDANANFADVKAGWLVSIYGGTGSGQLRTISTVTGTTQLNVPVWTTVPDATSKYMVWNPNEQTQDWVRIQAVRTDAKEYPNILYLKSNQYGLGCRIRLEYVARPALLTTEASTTVVPTEFLVRKSLAVLFGMRMNDNRTDRQRYTALTDVYTNLAEDYKQKHPFQMPEMTIPTTTETISNSAIGGSINPLGW